METNLLVLFQWLNINMAIFEQEKSYVCIKHLFPSNNTAAVMYIFLILKK